MGRELTRLEFLRVGAAGAALWAARAGWAESGSRPSGGEGAGGPHIPVGLQLYSVRNECAKDLPAVLSAVAAMGYEGVEFAGYHGRGAAELRRLLDDNGLRCCGTHLGIEALTGDELTKTVEFNTVLGNPYLIVASLPDERTHDRGSCLETAKTLDEISERAEAEGMRVGYHNHASDLRPINGTTAWDTIFSNTRPEVVMQIDTANMLAGGGDPVHYLRKYPGRAATIHVKEHSTAHPEAVIGEGEVDWRGLFDVIQAQGATNWLIVEWEGQALPPLVAVERCLANLRALAQ